MIHPKTRLHHINDQIGYGIFATALIPKGTIVYIKDPLEIEVSPELYAAYDEPMKTVIEKYSYIDENGVRILSWDLAKYVNHCCQCNTMSTGYGFEIAIKDIHPGEEITDEYGLFNLEYDMSLSCDKPGCRLKVSASDLGRFYKQWDEQLKKALRVFKSVDQPLLSLIDEDLMKELELFLADERHYRSVKTLQLRRGNGVHPTKRVNAQRKVLNGLPKNMDPKISGR